MNISTIRVRYAKAFFSLAKEKKMLDTLKADIEKVFNVCNHSADFVLLLESPVISTSKKTELITKIFKAEINTITLNFLLLIASNKREAYIPEICRNFLGLIRKYQNIKSAVLITASEINSKTIEKIRTLMEKELDAKVELASQVDSEIIGGLILRIGDKQYDSSVITQLRKIKQQLLNAEINY
ncbi:MAG TPA: ATP synthase F1 subunit delta [Draconibacterium sp.]|nr:ATP synthase F1 subunit delta [Draconibacterium sp.]